MSSPEGVKTPGPKLPLPDFADEQIPDMSSSATTGSGLGELRPEDMIVVEIEVPESEREPGPETAPKPDEPSQEPPEDADVEPPSE